MKSNLMRKSHSHRKHSAFTKVMAWIMSFIMIIGLASYGSGDLAEAAEVRSDGYRYGVSDGTWNERAEKILTTVNTIGDGERLAGHQQGFAIDDDMEYIYAAYSSGLVKVDIETGEVVGMVKGFSGHLGDAAYYDGRVYCSLYYEDANRYYIAAFDCDKITGEVTDYNSCMYTMLLQEVCKDRGATVNGLNSYYGCYGIDGVAFGTIPGDTSGEIVLMVSYGLYLETEDRQDSDYQIMLQYKISDFLESDGNGGTQFKSGVSDTLNQQNLHTKGPAHSDKYFIYTGNTEYGVQNLEYDSKTCNYIMAVYDGAGSNYNSEFPNYSMFYVDGIVAPRVETLNLGKQQAYYEALENTNPGCNNMAQGKVLQLAEIGSKHEGSGVWGSNSIGYEPSKGIDHIYGDYFYIAKDVTDNDSTSVNKQVGYAMLYKYDRINDIFTKVNRNLYEADIEYDATEEIIAVDGDGYIGETKVHGLVYFEHANIGTSYTAYTPVGPAENEFVRVRFTNPIDCRKFDTINLKIMYNNGATIYAFKEGVTEYKKANAGATFNGPTSFQNISFSTKDFAVDGYVNSILFRLRTETVGEFNANFFLDSVTLSEAYTYEGGKEYDASADIIAADTNDTIGDKTVYALASATSEQVGNLGEGYVPYTTSGVAVGDFVRVRFTNPIDSEKFGTIKFKLMYNSPSRFYVFKEGLTDYTLANAGASFTTSGSFIEVSIPTSAFAEDGYVRSVLLQVYERTTGTFDANFFLDSMTLFETFTYEADVEYDASTDIIATDANSTIGNNTVYALTSAASSQVGNLGTGYVPYTTSGVAVGDFVRVRFTNPIDSDKFGTIKFKLMYNSPSRFYVFKEGLTDYTEPNAGASFTTSGSFMEVSIPTSAFAEDGYVHSVLFQVYERTTGTFDANFFLDSITVLEECYCDVTLYRRAGSGSYTHPTKEGYVFAGWYTDKDYKTPLAEDQTSGMAYAKFVDEKVLSVKAQLHGDTTVDSVTTSMRFVTTVDCLDYEKVGFDINNGAIVYETTLVYKRITAGQGNVAFKYYPTLFSLQSTRFATVTLFNVPLFKDVNQNGVKDAEEQDNTNTAIIVKPYWVTADGTKVTGVIRDDITIQKGIEVNKNNTSNPYSL